MNEHMISPKNRPISTKSSTKQITQPRKKSEKRTIRFNQEALFSLPKVEKDTIFWFDGLSGFGIRISPHGNKRWIIQYTADGQSRKMVLGSYPKCSMQHALELYMQIKDRIDLGEDPVQVVKNKRAQLQQDIRLSELLDMYCRYSQQSGKKTYRGEYLTIKNGLGESILAKRLSQVKPQDIAKAVHRKLDNNTPVQAERLLKFSKRLFNYGAGLFLLEKANNPCIGITLDIRKNRRQRHLSPKEIYKFWHNIDRFPVEPTLILALKFLLCTAARSSEVRHLRWQDLDLIEPVWTLPCSKNKRMHRIPLASLSLDLLEQVRSISGNYAFVFPAFRCNGRSQRISPEPEPFKVWTLSQVFRRHFDKLEVGQSFYPHDLRRTAATLIAGLMGRREYAAHVLNHSSSDVTGIYDQYSYDYEKRMALEALNRAILLIIKSPNLASVPSFEEIRSTIRQEMYQGHHHLGLGYGSFVDPRAKFLNPGYDRLSGGRVG